MEYDQFLRYARERKVQGTMLRKSLLEDADAKRKHAVAYRYTEV